jgi:hypothetical protein
LDFYIQALDFFVAERVGFRLPNIITLKLHKFYFLP